MFPFKTVTLPVIQPASMDMNPFQQAGVNFSSVSVVMSSDHDSVSEPASRQQAQYRID